ncbi:hypothetical protein AVEN_163483-1 [Araneus ventricosus]|uniref:Reverse transcriptase domain-containing protein n=1 Tax=Araneus ventricosus TaxID=182803 RepID=A0A4Y2BPK3_ARAVE|nr:hypothetical protein AVEN_163483-1 [Araneus ventricosus]
MSQPSIFPDVIESQHNYTIPHKRETKVGNEVISPCVAITNCTYPTGRQETLNTPQGPATLPQHRGCPQGSCTGPAFWNLVANEVLIQSWPERVHLQAFADDFIFLIKASTKAKVESLANEALNQFKSWTTKHNLEISADKSNYMHFNKNRNGPLWSAGIRWEGNLLRRKSIIKYLGVFIDD